MDDELKDTKNLLGDGGYDARARPVKGWECGGSTHSWDERTEGAADRQ